MIKINYKPRHTIGERLYMFPNDCLSCSARTSLSVVFIQENIGSDSVVRSKGPPTPHKGSVVGHYRHCSRRSDRRPFSADLKY